jgi:hypothetical protein
VPKIKNIMGQTFAKLTAIERVAVVDGNQRRLCRCACGGEIVLLGDGYATTSVVRRSSLA